MKIERQALSQESNVRIDDVMVTRNVLLVTAESDRQVNGQIEWIDGAEFLVEWDRPASWSILRGSLYHSDLRPIAE